MLKIDFYEKHQLQNENFKYAVIVSKYKDKWILCKHKDRTTWEIPGGRRELHEDIYDTAKRELYEETGATVFEITPICPYSVAMENLQYTYGFLFYAEIKALSELPESEIECIDFFEKLPADLTYPDIQPKLLEKVLKYLHC